MARTVARTARLTFLFMTGWMLALATPAGAVTYAKFYNGSTSYSGPFSGTGTVYDATKSLTTDCPGGAGSCPGDVIGDPLTFSVGPGITATSPTSSVWDDLTPDYGGLGVGPGSPSDADQIASAAGDVLTLTFDSEVRLTGVGTLFASGHTPFGAGFASPSDVSGASGIVFSLTVDGTAHSVSFDDANNMALLLTGTIFEFSALSDNPDFYVSALSFDNPPPVGQVPIPGALPLFAGGLGALGLLGWRRTRRHAGRASV